MFINNLLHNIKKCDRVNWYGELIRLKYEKPLSVKQAKFMRDDALRRGDFKEVNRCNSLIKYAIESEERQKQIRALRKSKGKNN